MRKAVAIATTTHSDKAARLKELGADHILNVQDENYVAQVKAISGGKGAKVIFDPVAGPSTRHHIAAAASHATLFIYGRLDRNPMDIHPGVLMKKLLTVKGYTLYTLFENPLLLKQAVEGITQGLEQGLLQPIIAKQFSLEQVQQACAYMEANQQLGKIVINP